MVRQMFFDCFGSNPYYLCDYSRGIVRVLFKDNEYFLPTFSPNIPLYPPDNVIILKLWSKRGQLIADILLRIPHFCGPQYCGIKEMCYICENK